MTGVRTDQQTWATVIYDDAWIKNETAGGCRNYIDTFVNNPQFRIHLTDSDPDKDDDLCTVIIAVMQKYRRELKYAGIGNVGIGFEVYDVGFS
ncbi:unnamed protein product [Anisakis simplex]|uniref:Calpain clp-1 (inferred by orthology to a C. elegans protein) n=1 Tax=Anisakis simplex TaxID=6269 RepID=A0A0M3JH55_ANISI|nr:unnamed protein product [Anisakis simplex]